MNESKNEPSSFSPVDFEVLREKHAFFVIMAIATADGGLTFTEVKEKANLTNGTAQRRLDELCETNWLSKEAVINDSGKAVKKYTLSAEARKLQEAIQNLGQAIFK